MPEPHSTTTAGIAIGASIGLTGTVMGAQIDALLIGLVAAILISFWLPTIDDRRKAAASVALSSMLAGYGSPVAAGWLAGTQPELAAGSPLRLLVALALGALCPTLVPAIIGWAKHKVETQP